jgi:hypothetical protein
LPLPAGTAGVPLWAQGHSPGSDAASRPTERGRGRPEPAVAQCSAAGRRADRLAVAAINHPLGRARRLPLPTPLAQPNWWVLAGVLVAGVGAMLPVLQNSTATSEGYGAQRYQAETARLNGEIGVLEADVAQLTSLARIQRRAAELGLGPSENPIYVTVEEPGPAPAKIPSEYLPKAAPKGDAPAPWWDSLFGWLP